MQFCIKHCLRNASEASIQPSICTMENAPAAKTEDDRSDHESSNAEGCIIDHKILQVLFLTFFPPPLLVAPGSDFCLSSTAIAVLIANSNTWSTPFDSLALHSMYVAPIRFATA